MEATGLRPWRAGWAEQLQGDGCVLCGLIGVQESDWALRVFAGQWLDAYLPKSGSIPGYTVAVWNGRHVAEPTQLMLDEAAGYWRELLQVGRAVERCFEHAKMNYQLLGNGVPHLHAHVIPRPLLDPSPNRPLPWACVEDGRQDAAIFAAGAQRLRTALGDSPDSRTGI